jgi:CubicO group peptidase (beta-lactamase class C family)
MRFAAAREILISAIEARAFPAAVIEIGDSGQLLWREGFGRLSFASDAPPALDDTIFDLASLTKVLSTAALVMRQVERGALDLDDSVARYLPLWRSADRVTVTIRDLLSHSSGLPAHLHFYRDYRGRHAIEHAICETPLEYEPRTKSVYSDLGFMLLGFILEDVAPLPAQFQTLRSQMGGSEDLQFHPPAVWRTRTAPTQLKPERGGLIVGDVDDDNAWALGGAAGHAGLFGTAAAVGEYARHLLQVMNGRTGVFRKETLLDFITRRVEIPGSSRALAWDTMLPTSSCGNRMSLRAFGHTGFTGTSLWIDPDRGGYVTLLTNRVHPDASNDAIQTVRPAVHDAVMDAFGITSV